MGLVVDDDSWRIPDELWAQIQPLIPKGKPHPLGCHRPRVDDRSAMDAILFVGALIVHDHGYDYVHVENGICTRLN